MRLTNDLRKLSLQSWPECWLLLEAMAWLSLGRAAILLLRFRRVAGPLGLVQGNAQGDPAAKLDPVQGEIAAKIGWAVRTVADRLPGTTCLAQTLAGAAMLRRRGIPCALSLGIAKNEKGITAHAWLRCGDVTLTGANGRDRFTMISTFVAPVCGRRLTDSE